MNLILRVYVKRDANSVAWVFMKIASFDSLKFLSNKEAQTWPTFLSKKVFIQCIEFNMRKARVHEINLKTLSRCVRKIWWCRARNPTVLRIRFSHLLTRMMLDLFKWMIPRLLRVSVNICELEVQRQVGKLFIERNIHQCWISWSESCCNEFKHRILD